MSKPLPYYCPVLRGDYLKPPCEAQVTAAKERQHKFPHAVMPYGLDQCLKCKGAVLVTREGRPLPDKVVEVQGSDEMAEIVQEKGETKGIVQKPMIIFPTTNEVAKINTALDCQNERKIMTEIMTGKEDAERVSGREEFRQEIAALTAPRCPKHPDEPQVQCGPDSKRPGQYLGACKLCVAERKVGRKKKGAQESPSGLNIDAQPAPVATYPLAAVTEDPPLCKNPDCPTPGSQARIDRLGRSMGLCPECLSARGRKCGIENSRSGKTPPPISIPLNQPKYAPLKSWLEAQADENERTLQAQIMYVLKVSMREASAQ